jgi:hypothetical protein
MPDRFLAALCRCCGCRAGLAVDLTERVRGADLRTGCDGSRSSVPPDFSGSSCDVWRLRQARISTNARPHAAAPYSEQNPKHIYV